MRQTPPLGLVAALGCAAVLAWLIYVAAVVGVIALVIWAVLKFAGVL